MKLIRYKYPQVSGAAALNRLMGLGAPSFQRFLESGAGLHQPAADLYEDDANFYVCMELPGVAKDQIDLQLESGVLTIGNRRSDAPEPTQCGSHFERELAVPESVDVDQIAAAYEDGVLTVTLPKQAVPQPRQITVK